MCKCIICNKEFGNYRKLNGHKSVHKDNGRYTVSRKTKKHILCLNCGVATYNAKYCSLKCQFDFEWKIKVTNIENGNSAPIQQLKKYLLEKHHKKCQHCGIGEYWNNLPLTLQLDHIDGDSDNNRLDNLRILCPNCHTQTQTWCGRNKKDTTRNNYLRKYRGDKSKSETPLLHSGEQGALP